VDTVRSQIGAYKEEPMEKLISEIQLLCNSTTTVRNQFEKWP